MFRNGQDMQNTRFFGEISLADVSEAGGKGASLGEMTRAGIPVPEGFVVLAPVFESVLAAAGVKEAIESHAGSVVREDATSVERASRAIRNLIREVTVPEDVASELLRSFDALGAATVAVRSSATTEDSAMASWAGELDTYLNVTRDALVENVKRCWASLFTPRALVYRHEKGMGGSRISVAVVVQRMVQSEVSGVAFTVHPVTKDKSRMIVEAVRGLGELLVGGRVTPDAYLVDRRAMRVVSADVFEQKQMLARTDGGSGLVPVPAAERSIRKLDDAQVLKLADIALKVENHYGHPCDIEWGMEAGALYVLQCRPITAMVTPRLFEKTNTREGGVMTFEIWSKGTDEAARWIVLPKKMLPTEILANRDGVVSDYADPDVESRFAKLVVKRAEKEPELFERMFAEYDALLERLKPIWRSSAPLPREDLIAFFRLSVEAWEPFLMAYLMPDMDGIPEDLRERALKERRKGESFVDATDRVIERSLRALFPDRPDIDMLSFDELASGIVPDDATLAERRRRCVIAGGKLYDMAAEEFALSRNFVLKEDVVPLADVERIRGSIACVGHAVGRVRLILKKKDLATVRPGDVLVARMTSPDYLPAVQLAAAIVTDEGGITCHAAIVARELGKPCIIGTGVATRILKNDAVVEVDAMAGIVTVVERQSG